MRYVLVVLVLAAFLPAAVGQQDLAAAVVRIDSHGCSGTVVASSAGRTVILTSAHPWVEGDAKAPIRITAPAPSSGPEQRGTHPRILKMDKVADLALIEMQADLPYVLPVAMGRIPEGPQRTRSIGFDSMKWPSVNVPVTILSADQRLTYTRERPVPGRSGGPLVCDGQLVGVCLGFEQVGARRGLYVSLSAIKRFLGSASGGPTAAVREERSGSATQRLCPPGGPCPILGR